MCLNEIMIIRIQNDVSHVIFFIKMRRRVKVTLISIVSVSLNE